MLALGILVAPIINLSFVWPRAAEKTKWGYSHFPCCPKLDYVSLKYYLYYYLQTATKWDFTTVNCVAEWWLYIFAIMGHSLKNIILSLVPSSTQPGDYDIISWLQRERPLLKAGDSGTHSLESQDFNGSTAAKGLSMCEPYPWMQILSLS